MILMILLPLLLMAIDSSTSGSAAELAYSIDEELERGHVIADVIKDARLVSFYGPEVVSSLRFALLSPPPVNITVEPTSGRIVTSGRIDREAMCGGLEISAVTSSQVPPCRVRLDVAVHPVQHFRIVKIIVDILDVNDNDPEFRPAQIVRQMSESAPTGSGFVVPTAHDADSSRFGVEKYELLGVDGRQYDGPFGLKINRKLDGSTEVRLVLSDASRLDRETSDVHQLLVVAYDSGQSPRSGQMDVTVLVTDANDNSPVFEYNAYEVSIVENTPVGTTIARVVARDSDMGSNAEVEYTLSPGTQTAYGDIFAVDEITGDVIVSGLVDYERAPVYHLIIAARDRGPDPVAAETTVVVKVDDVNDNAPRATISTLTASVADVATVPENAPSGTFIAHVTVHDPDRGSSGRFNCTVVSLLAGGGVDDDGRRRGSWSAASQVAAEHSRHFRLERTFSAEYHLVTSMAATLDREQVDVYRIGIACIDGGMEPLWSIKELSVEVSDVNDNRPVFDRREYVAEIYENNYGGIVVFQVSATDADIGENSRLAYELSFDSAAEQDWTSLFDIDSETGTVTARQPLDRELEDEYHFRVKVRDHGSPSMTSHADVTVHVIDVNDEPPRFKSPAFHFRIPENQPSDTDVGTLVAVDLDSSPFSNFLFSLTPAVTLTYQNTGNGRQSTTTDGSFRIDATSGRIVTSHRLDREEQSEYHLTAVVFDPSSSDPQFTSLVPVVITVDDENDNDPVFVFPTTENGLVHVTSGRLSVGQEIGRVVAIDADDGPNAQVVYRIDDVIVVPPQSDELLAANGTSSPFVVDGQSGLVTARIQLEASTLDDLIFVVELTASDRGSSPRESTAKLRIVLDRRRPPDELNSDSDEQKGPRYSVVGGGGTGRFDVGGFDVITVTVFIAVVSAIVVALLITAICVVSCRRSHHRAAANEQQHLDVKKSPSKSAKTTVAAPGTVLDVDDIEEHRYNCRHQEQQAAAKWKGVDEKCPSGDVPVNAPPTVVVITDRQRYDVTSVPAAQCDPPESAVNHRVIDCRDAAVMEAIAAAKQEVHSDYSSAESLTTGSLLQRQAADEISNQRGVDRRALVDGGGDGGTPRAVSGVPSRMTSRQTQPEVHNYCAAMTSREYYVAGSAATLGRQMSDRLFGDSGRTPNDEPGSTLTSPMVTDSPATISPALTLPRYNGSYRAGELMGRTHLHHTSQPHSTSPGILVANGSTGPAQSRQPPQQSLGNSSRTPTSNVARQVLQSPPVYQNFSSFKSPNSYVAGNGHSSLASEVMRQHSVDSCS